MPQNKILFITGGRGAIGNGIVSKFKKYNYIIDAPSSIDLDLSDISNIHKYIKNPYVEIDTLIYAAGINKICPLRGLIDDEINKSMNINALSFLKLSQQLNIKDGGSIIYVGSLFTFLSKKNRIYYTISKHASLGIVKSLALSFAERGITVNCVSPGFVDTEMTSQNNTKEQILRIIEDTPMKQLVAIEDIADTCYFLANQHSITGQNIVVDKGFSIQ